MAPGCAWSAFEWFDGSQPGAVVAVASRGRLADWRSFGAVAPGGAALAVDTPLYVASLAKQFTAACVGLLVLEGVVSTSDPVGPWFPELGSGLDRVCVEHLLAHTSGLPLSNDLDQTAGFKVDRSMTTLERINVLRDVQLDHEPGTAHRYSNYGYVLLAEIVRRVTGSPLGVFAAQQIFNPLGMAKSGYLDVMARNSAPGWRNGVERVDVGNTCVGDGGLVSTVADMTRWDAWLPTSEVGALMLEPRPTMPNATCAHDAWGISIRTHHGQRIESHGGVIDGYLAKHVRFPELHTSFIALANNDALGVAGFDACVHQLADATLAEHLDFAEPSWVETITRPGPPV